ncbi:hypothetical protein CEXT_715701, partial [Caerostris extrusa]
GVKFADNLPPPMKTSPISGSGGRRGVSACLVSPNPAVAWVAKFSFMAAHTLYSCIVTALFSFPVLVSQGCCCD